MRVLLRLRSALRNLLRKQQVETELDAEIHSYVDAIADEKIASGISPKEARRQALAECGGLEQVKQAVRDERASTLFESIIQDIRYGLRQMRRNPAFSLTAIITLALGIGATTAIFSAVYALLIRPLPYPGSNRLIEIFQVLPREGNDWNPLLGQDFVAAKSKLKSVSIAGWNDWDNMNLTGTGDPLRVSVMQITANFLPLLRVTPALGRNFLSNEDRPGGPAVAMLSHRLWESRFDGNAGILGHSITLGGKAWTVVGVLPAHFLFPDPGFSPDIYVPLDLSTNTNLGTTKLTIQAIPTIGRLRTGVTLQQAQAELNLFFRNRRKGYAPLFVEWSKGRHIVADPLQKYLTGDQREPLLILLACVGAVLLIACVNVANLQLARSVARQHEMALRGALGAGRLRLVRQSLVESLTLATLATVLGLGIAFATTWLIRRGGMPGTFSSGSYAQTLLQAPLGKLSTAVQVNGWVLGFAAGLALLATVLFGLAPAIGASRADLRSALQESANRVSSGRQQRRLRSLLLMAEIGLAVLLLTGAGLLMRSFVNLLHNDSGFEPRQCLTAQMQRNWSEPPEKVISFVDELLPRLKALPGVRAAAIASVLPLQRCYDAPLAFGAGPPLPRLERPRALRISVSPGYFQAAGTQVLQGRPFSDQDNSGAAPVVIVNQAFVHRYLHADALGQQFRVGVSHRGFVPMTIVGVVQNVRYGALTAQVEPAVYFPFDQEPGHQLNILLRTSVEPGSLASAMRNAVLHIDPDQPLFDVKTMDELISQSVAQQRLTMLLTASFALLALLLAGVGIYGVFTYWVNQRRQEMGIRLALGSSRPELLRLIIMQAMRLILAGGILGLVGAWFLDHLLSSMLVGVKAHDPISFTLAWASMTLIALLGSLLPAMNAARTNPLSVLRSE